jgi:pimeloyl-ACP methyl ester carboxylesterase
MLPVVGLILIAVVGGLIYRASIQSGIAATMAIESADGIDEMISVEIGGIQQWILIRGENKDNPVLLYLHGGPGSSNLPFIHLFQRRWEKDFTVVQWDQRGAGRTHRTNGPGIADTLSLDRMVRDAEEVVEFLCRRLGRDRIVLLGHSWGSILGMHLLKERPERFHAYVGVGQVVNMQDNERVSYEYTLRRARALGNENAIEDLESIGRPPYTGSQEEIYSKLGIQRRWLLHFGGAFYGQTSMTAFLKLLLFTPELSLLDIYYWIDGNIFSIQNMDDFFDLDLRQLGANFEVPLFFFIGRHDYQTPFELSRPYFESLSAPHKEWLWFDEAAHAPPMSMPEEFARALIERVRPHANPD